MQSRVGWGTKGLTRLVAPIEEAIFLQNLWMWKCHVRLSSIYTASDFTEKTRFNRNIINGELKCRIR